MSNSSYFRFDDDDKTTYIYSLNHHKELGKPKTHSSTYCIIDNYQNELSSGEYNYHCVLAGDRDKN